VQTARDLVAAARGQVENLSPEAVAAELDARGVVLVDVREPAERDDQGVIAGAVHMPRGMLEFYADPSSAAHLSDLLPERRVILHCASGGRSALAAATLAAMGYRDVAHLDGGLAAWREAGLPLVGS
jgi:rhodanese-related sulfurtransferase